MARLWSSGFELNSLTANVEFTSVTGSPTIQTSIVRSGTYAMRSNPTGATAFVEYTYGSSNSVAAYVRFFIYIATATDALDKIFQFGGSSPGIDEVSIRMNSDRTLELWNDAGVGSQLGSNSDALNTDQWHMIEVFWDASSGTSTEARLDGVSFASGNATGSAAGVVFAKFGCVTTTTADLYFDDIAINDDSGSFQNSWPGEGGIIHLRPNAAGDDEQWVFDYDRIDEVTPDDGSTFIAHNILNQTAEFNLDATPTDLASDATVNVVQVGTRFHGSASSSNASFVLRIKATSGGTVEESSAITPPNTTWVTNAIAAPRNYHMTLYDLPGSSTDAWTKTTLDTAQIGVRISTQNTNNVDISTMWLLVDYTAGEGEPEPPATVVVMPTLLTLGVG